MTSRSILLKSIVLLFLVTVINNAAIGQLSTSKSLTQFSIKNWQIEDGLPQNSITFIYQDSNGFIWIGTYDGLVRFDGNEFITFNRRNNPKLNSSYILSITEDSNGSLFIGTSGDGVWIIKNNSLSKFDQFEVLNNSTVNSLITGVNNEIWIGTYGDGLFKYSNGKLQQWKVEDGLAGNIVQNLFLDSDNLLWGGTRGSGIFRMDQDEKFHVYDGRHGISNTYIRDIKQLQTGQILVSTAGGGVFEQRKGDFEWEPTEFNSFLSSQSVNKIWVEPNGQMWFATESGGLNRYYDGKINSLSALDGIGSDAIKTLIQDNENNLWLGTSGGGLTKISDGAFTSISTLEGLHNNFAWTIEEDKYGVIWVGTNGSGVSLIKNGQVINQINEKQGLKNSFIRSILSDKNGVVWVATYKGIHLFKNRKLIQHINQDNGLPSDIVLSLYEDVDGIIWAGTSGGGLVNFSKYKIKDIIDSKSGLSNEYVRCILKRKNGQVWIGTGGGGINILTKDKKLTKLTTDEGLKSNTIIALHEDERNRVWVGTHGGGLSMIEQSNIYSATVSDGLPDDIIFHILEDEMHFWMSSNRGIFSLTKRSILDHFYGKSSDLQIQLYSKDDGLKSSECNGANQPAALIDSKGNFWFPTVKGVSYINPKLKDSNPVTPQVQIESVNLDYKTDFFDLPNEIDYKAKSLVFKFTAPLFTANHKLKFDVMLEGFDPTWIPLENNRQAIYTNLPSDDYIFHVRIRSPFGNIVQSTASYPFTVLTPWYRSIYAWLIYISILSGLGFVIYRNQKELIRKKNEEQLAIERLQFEAENERLNREASESRTRELETKFELQIQKNAADIQKSEREREKAIAKSFAEGIEKERARIARELHDQILGSLSSIMRKVQIEAKKTNSFDDLMSKMDLLLQQLDKIGHEIRNIMDDLKPGTLEIFSLSDTLDSLLQKSSDQSPYFIRTEVRSTMKSPTLTPYQNVTIYRIFQEGIYNAINHAKPSYLLLEIEVENDELIIQLKNDGSHFDVDHVFNRIRESKSKSGNGLLNIQHRAQTLNAEVLWESKPELTTLTFKMPLNTTSPVASK